MLFFYPFDCTLSPIVVGKGSLLAARGKSLALNTEQLSFVMPKSRPLLTAELARAACVKV